MANIQAIDILELTQWFVWLKLVWSLVVIIKLALDSLHTTEVLFTACWRWEKASAKGNLHN